MIEIKNVVAGYQNKTVIRNLDLRFKEGEFCALLGPNGAGKSTLLKVLLGYIKPEEGFVKIVNNRLAGWKKSELAKIVSLIPQKVEMQFDYTVEDLVLMGRFPYLGYWRGYSAKDREIVQEALQQLDLYEMRNEMFSQLSGGEQQRVAIARALVQDTPIILMDEAFSHLDINHQLEIMQILSRINREQNKLIILVSHNINLTSEYCDRIIFLKKGQLVDEGTPEEVLIPETLKTVYGADLQTVPNPVSGKPNLIYPVKK